MKRATWTVAMALVVGLCVLTPAAAYDVYKTLPNGQPIPDVDKKPVPPPDNTCWQAAASNLLAAGGWGLAGQTAQQNGDAIFGQLTAHFGTAQPGCAYRAVNWWLLNYGYNPDAPDANYYSPTKTYNDVTYKYNSSGLSATDYDWLLSELVRCQYVTVAFDKGTDVGHEMALVGGNYSPWHMPPGGMPQVSVWHDSDQDTGGTDDDPHGNTWPGAGPNSVWLLNYQDDGNPNNDWLANAYTTLCPGLQKPRECIENYDVAYFKDMDPNVPVPVWFNRFREAGKKKNQFNAPSWYNESTLHIDNETVANKIKQVWLLVDYFDRDNTAIPNVRLKTNLDPNGVLPTRAEGSPDAGQVRFVWQLGYQPDWEELVFPNANYYNLSGDVKDFNVATLCAHLGDASLDDSVGLLDLGILAANWNMNNRTWATADFNADGVCALIDLGVLAANWNWSAGGGAPIPEPTTLTLLAIGGLALARRGRR